MRASMIEAFHETMNYCFDSVVQDMLGGRVRDEIFRLLERNGRRPEVPLRFDDVVRVLTGAFGNSARVVIYKTVVELYTEYSQRAEFSYNVARRIGRIAKAIESDVNDLVTLGVLKTRQVGGRQVISLDRSKDREPQENIVGYLKGISAGASA